MTMYERIENMRKSVGISQGKLEKELGFSNGSISKWKNSTPTPDRLQKLADFFNVSVDYLITGEEKTPTTIISSQATNYFIQMVYDVAEAEFGKIQAEEFSQKVRDNLPSDFGMPKKSITLAAHFDGEEYTEDELDEIRQFAEFVKNKRK